MKTVNLILCALCVITTISYADCDVANPSDFLINAKAKPFVGTCSINSEHVHRTLHYPLLTASSKKLFISHGTYGERFGGVLYCKGGKWSQVFEQENPDDTHTFILRCQ